jgi:hypothetical protein
VYLSYLTFNLALYYMISKKWQWLSHFHFSSV